MSGSGYPDESALEYPAMADANENRASLIRQRIVGVLVLVSLAAVFVPYVIDFRRNYEQIISGSNIPPQPDEFRVEILQLDQSDELDVPELALRSPLPGDPASYPSSSIDEETGKLPDTRSLLPTETDDETGDESRPAAAERNGGRLPAGGAWVIQLGSFNSENNALALRDRLRDRGYAAFVKRGRLNNRPVFRVQIGPEVMKKHADRIRDEVKQDFRIEGMVIRHR